MAEEVEIDWSGFDPVEVPEPPPAEKLAAEIEAEVVAELVAAPAPYDVKKLAVREPNTYDCRDGLRAMGCHWMADPVEKWVARDELMLKQAINFCRIAAGKKAPFPDAGLHGSATAHLGEPEDPEPKPVRRSRNFVEKIAERTGSAGVGVAGGSAGSGGAIYANTGVVVGAGGGGSYSVMIGGAGGGDGSVMHSGLNVDNETLIAEAERRGFTIAKLGKLKTLAELLVDQDDEDTFEKILEVLK